MPSLGKTIAGAVLGKNEIAKFLQSDLQNAWIKHKGYKVYVRKSKRQVPNSQLSDDDLRLGMRPAINDVLDIGAIERVSGGSTKTLPVQKRKRGKLKEVLNDLQHEAAKSGREFTYVEQVHNEFLPEVLQRYGYAKSNTPGENSFYRSFYKGGN